MVSPTLSAVFAGLRDIQSIRYSQLASSVIIILDHLLTLDEEVELIWKGSWSLGKGIFILNRYYTLFSVIFNNYALFAPNLSDSVSLRFIQWQGWTGLISCMTAEVALQMRLYALYFLDRQILALMVIAFVFASAGSATIMGIVLSRITVTAHPIPGVTFCTPSNVAPWFYAFWIPILAFESMLCGLAIFRGFQTFRSNGPLFQSGRKLVGILIRDSVLYFLVMFASYFTNLLIWILASESLLEIPITFSVAMSCVMGNRLILNVREVNRDLEQSKPTARRQALAPAPDILSEIEMAQLRTMRAENTDTKQFIVLRSTPR